LMQDSGCARAAVCTLGTLKETAELDVGGVVVHSIIARAGALPPPRGAPVSGLPKPIRVERRLWVCMRNDAVLPKAEIRLVRRTPMDGGPTIEQYRVILWNLEPELRKLVGYYWSLEEANAAVLFDVPDPESIVRGQDAFGMYKADAGPRPRRIDA
jgi:hypothetical protein